MTSLTSFGKRTRKRGENQMPRREPTKQQNRPRELQSPKPKSVAESPKSQTLRLGIVVTLGSPERRRSSANPLHPLNRAAPPRLQSRKSCSRISTSIGMSRTGTPLFLRLIRLNVETTVRSLFTSPCKSFSCPASEAHADSSARVQRKTGERARESSSVCRERFPQKVRCKLDKF